MFSQWVLFFRAIALHCALCFALYSLQYKEYSVNFVVAMTIAVSIAIIANNTVVVVAAAAAITVIALFPFTLNTTVHAKVCVHVF